MPPLWPTKCVGPDCAAWCRNTDLGDSLAGLFRANAMKPHSYLWLVMLITCLGGTAQQPAPVRDPAPDPAAAIERLQTTFADKDPGRALAAVEACGRIANDDVVKQVAKGLSHKEPLVQRAVLQALRHNSQPAALTALLAAAGSEKLLADDKVAADYYLALGQKGDAKALPVLTKGLHVDRGSEVTGARILAIGHIRSPQSVAELMQMLKSGGGGRRGGGGNPHMKDLRLALAALTGEDFGGDATAWIQWWADHDNGYKLPAHEGQLPKGLARTWETTWRDPASAPTKPAPGQRDGGEHGKSDESSDRE